VFVRWPILHFACCTKKRLETQGGCGIAKMRVFLKVVRSALFPLVVQALEASK